MSEYKLSYTASEIDRKLGQVDSKVDASQLNSAIDTTLQTVAAGTFTDSTGTITT